MNRPILPMTTFARLLFFSYLKYLAHDPFVIITSKFAQLLDKAEPGVLLSLRRKSFKLRRAATRSRVCHGYLVMPEKRMA
jgi:hypothetical protein